MAVAAIFETQRFVFVITHGQRYGIHRNVAIEVTWAVSRAIHSHERPEAEVSVHSERVRPGSNRRDSKRNADVKA